MSPKPKTREPSFVPERCRTVNGAKGYGAFQASRDLDCQYKIAFLLAGLPRTKALSAKSISVMRFDPA